MRIFPYGLEINDHDVNILKEEMDDIELWIVEQIAHKISVNKEAIKTRWMTRLEQDDSLESYPKKIDDLIRLIMSRPYFKTRAQRVKDELILNQSKFTVE